MSDLPTVVCFGDSNTWGAIGSSDERFARDVRWPGVVARELAGRAHVVEEGLPGRTTTWDDPFSAGRNGATYLEPCLESHAPVAVLVILLGTNDLKAIHRVGPAEIAAGAASLVDHARRSGTGPDHGPPEVLLVAPVPLGLPTLAAELWGFGAAREASRRLAPLYREAATQSGAAFLDAATLVEVDPADGVHLDAKAHDTLGRAVAAAVAPLLPGSTPRTG
ncbi:MAG: SGNH/GDSL hydrolase family protein [Chloroflexi bacterium]|nr:SGNH/GDSL hydrolase family protein [Chloroflexota bacterium]